MNSEMYREPGTGSCRNEGRCGVNETVCHKMNATSMRAIHNAYTKKPLDSTEANILKQWEETKR